MVLGHIALEDIACFQTSMKKCEASSYDSKKHEEPWDIKRHHANSSLHETMKHSSYKMAVINRAYNNDDHYYYNIGGTDNN